MSELPEGVLPAEVPAPRDSALGVLLRPGPQGIEALLVLRSRRSRFMPGHLAFPGGVLESADEPDRPGAFARCASREVREETGLDIPETSWIAAGTRVTPPLYPLRFHTEFFAALLPAGWLPTAVAAGGEIEELQVLPAQAVLDRWTAGQIAVPPPVLPILRALAGAPRADSLRATAECIAGVNAQEERAPRIEFFPDVWMLPQQTPTLPPATHTNAWMPGGKRFVIVDPGSADPQEISRLIEVVERRRSLGHEPAAVLLTHGHRDHIGGAVEVARRLGLPLRAHRLTLQALDPHGGEPMDTGDVLDLGGMTLHALHTPGHHPGHLVFHLPEPRLLIVGDLVSGLSTILIDPDGGAMEEYLESLARAERLGCRALLPGHGAPLPGSELRRVIEHREAREARIVEHLARGPCDLPALARVAYSDAPTAPPRLAQRQALAHLERLERSGAARRIDSRGATWAATAAGSPADTPARIVQLLTEHFAPLHLAVDDESAAHAGHPGAAEGGGHYRVTLVSAAFAGKGRLERHRMVNQVLADLLGGEIHALVLNARTPEEWDT